MEIKTKSKYMKFSVRESLPKFGLKEVVCAHNKNSGYLLGCFEYYKKWREWQFVPQDGMAFTEECLADLTNVCKELNEQKDT